MPDKYPGGTDPAPCRRAKELLRAGRHDEVVRLLEPLTILEPDDADVWRLLGMAQASRGDLAEAVGSLERAVGLAPGEAQTRFNLAVALRAKGDVARSREQAERALDLDPHYALARKLLDDLPAPPLAEPAPSEAPLGGRDPAAGRQAEQERDRQRARELLEQEAAAGEWCWDGFLWGLGAPWLWLASHGPAWLAFAALLVPRAFVWAAAGAGPAAVWACLALHGALAAYLGLRGGRMSWHRRSFRSVKDFRACHRIWLLWALVPAIVACAVYRVDRAIVTQRAAAPPPAPARAALP